MLLFSVYLNGNYKSLSICSNICFCKYLHCNFFSFLYKKSLKRPIFSISYIIIWFLTIKQLQTSLVMTTKKNCELFIHFVKAFRFEITVISWNVQINFYCIPIYLFLFILLMILLMRLYAFKIFKIIFYDHWHYLWSHCQQK